MSFAKQLLAHGKLLTAKAFPTFVETWNWLVDAFGNLKGDGDLNPEEGFVQIDRSNPMHPVVRLINRGKLGSGESGGGGETITLPPKPFDFADGYIEGGSIPCPVAYLSANGYAITKQTTVVYLHIDLSYQYPSQYTLTIDETSRTNTNLHAQFKLYEITNGEVTLDCRPSVIPVLAL